uniref:Ovule protein n=1 Tax=Ascaris lumbricoides TaxID=6252 RepID=A0A0M3IP25_ASCLU
LRTQCDAVRGTYVHTIVLYTSSTDFISSNLRASLFLCTFISSLNALYTLFEPWYLLRFLAVYHYALYLFH